MERAGSHAGRGNGNDGGGTVDGGHRGVIFSHERSGGVDSIAENVRDAFPLARELVILR